MELLFRKLVAALYKYPRRVQDMATLIIFNSQLPPVVVKSSTPGEQEFTNIEGGTRVWDDDVRILARGFNDEWERELSARDSMPADEDG
jgi:hypothetical protein